MECASYVGEVAGSGNGHHHRTGRGQSQMRYTPYDVPTGVLSPPPDYGKGQSQIRETDSWFFLGQNLYFSHFYDIRYYVKIVVILPYCPDCLSKQPQIKDS